MVQKFKVGDKVRVIDGGKFPTNAELVGIGHEFTVTKVKGSLLHNAEWVRGDNHSYGVWVSNLELVENYATLVRTVTKEVTERVEGVLDFHNSAGFILVGGANEGTYYADEGWELETPEPKYDFETEIKVGDRVHILYDERADLQDGYWDGPGTVIALPGEMFDVRNDNGYEGYFRRTDISFVSRAPFELPTKRSAIVELDFNIGNDAYPVRALKAIRGDWLHPIYNSIDGDITERYTDEFVQEHAVRVIFEGLDD